MAAKLTKAEQIKLEAYYADHIRNCVLRLPLKARVVMTDEALQAFPRYRGVKGTVVRHKYHGTGASPVVLWDGRKTADSYAPWFIQRVGRKSLSLKPEDGR